MAKITRYNGNLRAFGVDAPGVERTIFGSPAGSPVQSDDLTTNIDVNFSRGWGTLALGDKPPREWFNGFAFAATQLAAYLHQRGIAEYDALQEYFTGSMVQENGALLVSQEDDNVGGDVSDGSLFSHIGVTFADTFANLVSRSPTATGQRFRCVERGFAPYTLLPQGATSRPGDAIFANGRVASLDINSYASVKWFGALGDASGQSTEINNAVSYLSGNGGGVLFWPNGRYGLTEKIVVPKDANITFRGERVSKDSSLSPDPDSAGVEVYAVNAMDEMIEWNGDATVTTQSNLARGFYIYDMHLNGNNQATHIIDCLNVDSLWVMGCRLTGAVNGIRSLFNGTFTGLLLAGAIRLHGCNFGALGGVNVELDGHTQCWIDNNWFAGTGPDKQIVINRSNKISISDNEFNGVGTNVLELNDGASNEATQDILIVGNKIALTGAQDVIADTRTNSSSRRVVFEGNTVVNGAEIVPQSLHNAASNIFDFTQTTSSRSFVDRSNCREASVDNSAGFAKLNKCKTGGVDRWQFGADSSAETGGNAGSDFVLQRLSDAGALLATELTIDRQTGRMAYSFATATGNGSTIDANTGQVTTDSLTVGPGGSVNILFNNSRVNFTPIVCQMRSYSGAGDPIISKTTTGAGTFTITVRNLDTVNALNAPLNFMFHVL